MPSTRRQSAAKASDGRVGSPQPEPVGKNPAKKQRAALMEALKKQVQATEGKRKQVMSEPDPSSSQPPAKKKKSKSKAADEQAASKDKSRDGEVLPQTALKHTTNAEAGGPATGTKRKVTLIIKPLPEAQVENPARHRKARPTIPDIDADSESDSPPRLTSKASNPRQTSRVQVDDHDEEQEEQRGHRKQKSAVSGPSGDDSDESQASNESLRLGSAESGNEEEDEDEDESGADNDFETPQWAGEPESSSAARTKSSSTRYRPKVPQVVSSDSESAPSSRATPLPVSTSRKHVLSDKPAPRSSKRAVANSAYETPRFPSPSMSTAPDNINEDDDDEHPPVSSSAPSDNDAMEMLTTAEPVSNPSQRWPTSTNLVLPENGGRIKILSQNADVQNVFQAALVLLYGRLFWDNPFPAGLQKSKFERDSLYEAAKGLGIRSIQKRLKNDTAYNKKIADVLDNRLSSFRNSLKTSLVTAVGTSFQLSTPEDIANTLHDDEYTNGRIEGTNKIDKNAPYLHRAILSCIKSMFFDGRRSIAEICHDRFISSMPDDPMAKLELEVPPQMVAMVATSMYAAIKFFGKKQPEFSTNVYTEVYLRHIATLEDIKQDNARAHHILLARIYKYCIGSSTINGRSAEQRRRVDTSGMPTTMDD